MTPTERERLTALETSREHMAGDLRHIRKNTERIFEKLDEQGDVRKDLDKHIDGHWRAMALVVSVASFLTGLVLKYWK